MLRHRDIAVLVLVCLVSYFTCQAQVISPLTDTLPMTKFAHKLWAQKKWLLETNMTFLEELLDGLYPNLFHWARSGRNVSGCQSSLLRLPNDTWHRDPYAIRALDSHGKLESGILMGNLKWSGRYYECLSAKGDQFQGKWCSFVAGKMSQLTGTVVGLTVGVCVPDACSEKTLNDAISYIDGVISHMSHQKILMYAQCPVQPTEWKATDVIFVIILFLLVVLIAVGTTFDSYIKYRNEKQRNQLVIDDVDVLPELNSHKFVLDSAWAEALVSFSIIRNVRSLFTVERKPGTIDCLHGIRFLSMSWVVLGHTFVMVLEYIDNPVDLVNYMYSSVAFQAVANAFFSVDSFFFLSGLLVAYLSLKNANRLTVRSVPMLYLQRYLRLTPAYAFLILFFVGFLGKMGNGPNWPAAFNSSCNACKKYWWTNLLYINNLHPSGLLDECFALGWYLANDMQFFLLAPISLLIIKRSPKVGLNLLVFGIFSSMLVTGIISSHYKLQPLPVMTSLLIWNVTNSKVGPIPFSQNNSFLDDVGEIPRLSAKEAFWSDTYAKPWCRIGVYLIGMITGYFLFATRCSIRMSKTFVMSGWAVAAALNLSVLYGLWWHVHNIVAMDVSLAAFYDALCRPIWAVGLAWVVFACATGYGGPVNSFLSWKAFVPLSRLTFCTYLIHPTVIALWFGTQEVEVHYSITQFAFFYIAILTMSHGGAFILAMLVEAPFVNLVKALMKNRVSSEGGSSLIVNEVPNEQVPKRFGEI